MITLPIKNFMTKDAGDIIHNRVQLSITYDKKITGPVLRIDTGEDTSTSGFSGFRTALFGSPSTKVTIETGWKTNNKKKLEAVTERVRAEINKKEGELYTALTKFLADNNSEILS